MAGGILTSLVVWLLAWRNGIETFRLIIIGIGVRAMLVAFNTWLLLRLRWKPRSPPGCGTPVRSTA
jgi:iron complex transport system permease protein